VQKLQNKTKGANQQGIINRKRTVSHEFYWQKTRQTFGSTTEMSGSRVAVKFLECFHSKQFFRYFNFKTRIFSKLRLQQAIQNIALEIERTYRI
jgi:hypothetical protein